MARGPGIDDAALIRFAQQLVRIPSVYDEARGLNEEPVAELIGAQMSLFGWEPRFDRVAPGRPNVFAVIEGGRRGPTLMFEGHSDVVTEGDPADWTLDPFGATIAGGRLWGRGSADMKAGVASMLFGVDAFVRSGSFPGRVVVAVLVDEEGMMAGAKDFVRRGRMNGVDGVICCEPEGGEICHVAKGAIRLRIDFDGVMAHGAMPFQGRNPNRALAAALVALGELEAALHDRFGEDQFLGKLWLTPTVLRAGEPAQMNVIPASATVWVDVRTIPGVDHRSLVVEIETSLRAVGKASGIDIRVSVIDDRPAVSTAHDHRLVTSLSHAHLDVTGTVPVLGGVPGATDGTVLTSRTGVASVVYGPGGKWIAHQANEFVAVDELARYGAVYAAAARRFLES